MNAEFEVVIGQLLHHIPHSFEQFSALKARLSDLAHAYCGKPVDIGNFPIVKEYIQAGKSLRCNENIHIITPDKESGVAIINKSNNISKMHFILQDSSKFENFGPSSKTDNTAKNGYFNSRKWPSSIQNFQQIQPTGFQRSQMCGLKIHKKDAPLCPILSITSSTQQQLAQWLASVIDPAFSFYSTHCISDSFTFTDKVILSTTNFPPSAFLSSYDVFSLFTNVPVAEIIEICIDALYNDKLTLPSFPWASFVELMQMTTTFVEFSFNNTVHSESHCLPNISMCT